MNTEPRTADAVTRKKANTYFFSKVIFNICLIVLGAVLISVLLRGMQRGYSLTRQKEDSETALNEAIRTLEENSDDAEVLTTIFHDGNQDTLSELRDMLTRGLFNSLKDKSAEERADVLSDIIDRSGVSYLFLMGQDGTVLLSPVADLANQNLVEMKLLTEQNLQQLLSGTRTDADTVIPVEEHNTNGDYYFYSQEITYDNVSYYLILGADIEMLDIQLASLKDISTILKRAAIGNNGFLFAVDPETKNFLYYENEHEVLTGMNALNYGLSEAALQNGYTGLEMINGIKYYCVSRTCGEQTVVCAVADTESIYANDKYVLFWSVTGFILIMLLCLSYAVIVRNDFVRRETATVQKVVYKGKVTLLFDYSIFQKVLPLMVTGLLIIFGISFYTQTLLEISESIADSELALKDISSRFEESNENRDVIQNYYDSQFLSKAKLISYLLEEDPAVLNLPSENYYAEYDEQNLKHYLIDDEGNRLRSIANVPYLKQLCAESDLDAIYIYDETGRTIATSTSNWYFALSHDPEHQSYPFYDVVNGYTDSFVQDTMIDDNGEESQYLGVSFHYYTTRDAQGNTVYVSRYDYENQQKSTGSDGSAAVYPNRITSHRSLLQIRLQKDLASKLLASTEVSYVLSTDALSDGFIVLYDDSEEHRLLYSPNEVNIGKTAKELGISGKAFDGNYYGFQKVGGITYFQYYTYTDGYHIATAIPTSTMYRSRFPISLVTALLSFLLILILTLTVVFTTEEEEELYRTMSEVIPSNSIDSAIFNVILPSGHVNSTVRASARWDNRHLKWSERTNEQKLLMLLTGVFGLLTLYIIICILLARSIFAADSIILYILGGEWDRGWNIFAISACAALLIFTFLGIDLIRIPIRLITSLFGTRVETIGHLLISVIRYGGVLAALFYCLYLLGLDSSSLLASAGILSLVIGLGAQSLIKDIIAGIFIVFEGEFRVGDIVTVGDYRGTVVDIGLRTTKILNTEGNIKIFENSEISGVINMTKAASWAAATIGIEYGQDIDYVESVLRQELPLIAAKDHRIIDGPNLLGVNKLNESSVDLLIVAQCMEKDIKGVTRMMNKEILKIFYKHQINVPFPQVTMSNLTAPSHPAAADTDAAQNTMQDKE